jgi:hypothetical protein
MSVKLAACLTLLATASVATAQTRPPVGTVYFTDRTDCVTATDAHGYPVCVMSSSGGEWTDTAAFRAVTSMALPYGRYTLDAKVLDYMSGSRPLDPWVSVECVLEDQNHNRIDYTSASYGGHLDYSIGGTVNRLTIGLQAGTPMVLSGVVDVPRAGATVSISCRVQGQAAQVNGDGSTAWGAPIENVQFHDAQIRAVSAAAIIVK